MGYMILIIERTMYTTRMNGISFEGDLEYTAVAIGRPDNKQNRCRTGEECEREARGLPLVAIATMSKRNR